MPIDRSIVAKDYKSGMTITSICKTHNICDKTVHKILDEYDVSRRPLNWKLRSVDDQAIIRSYKTGLSAKEVGKTHGVSKKSVIRILNTNSIPRHNQRIVRDIDAIRRSYKDGMSRPELAKIHGVSVAWIVKKTKDIKNRKKKPTLYDKVGEEVIKMYRQGQSYATIADELHVKYTTVRSLVNKSGIAKRKRKTSKHIILKIKAMYAKGIGSPTISKKLGVDKSTVLKYVDGMGKITKPQHKTEKSKIKRHIRTILHHCKRHPECTITEEYLFRMFYRQKKRCKLTDLLMIPEHGDLQSASLDRIDQSKGYVKKNVRFVCKFANLARHTHSDKEFHNLIKKLVERSK